MDTFLRHLMSLRKHMNEHEDKMDCLATTQHEQQTVIHALHEDLKRVRQESKRLEREIGLQSRERDDIFISIQRSQRSLVPYEAKCCSLAEALQVLREEVKKQSSFLVEKQLYFDEIERTTRIALEISETGRKTRRLPESNLETKEDSQTVQANSDCNIMEDFTDTVGLERHLKFLINQRQLAEETLKDLHCRYHEMEIAVTTLEEELLHLRTEKTEEEEFKGSLDERVTQLKVFSQQITCGSCGHDYTIQYKDSDFTVVASSVESLVT